MWASGRSSILFFLLMLAYIGFCFAQLGMPPLEDEILTHHGSYDWFLHGATWFEMTHSPGYLESLSLWQRIWGPATHDRVWVVRSFGLFTGLLTAMIFYCGLRGAVNGRIDPHRQKSLADYPLLATGLLVLNPYFIQSSLVLVSDAGICRAPLLLMMIGIERWDHCVRPRWGQALVLGSLLAMNYMGKEITPCLFVVLLPIWAILRKWRAPDQRWLGHFIQSIAIGVLGVALFFLMLQAWGKLRGFHWYDPLQLTQRKFLSRHGPGSSFNPIQMFGWVRFAFLSYLPWIWFSVSALFVLGSSVRFPARGLRIFAQIPFSIWFCLAMFVLYGYAINSYYYYPSYTAPAWPIFLYGVAGFIPMDRGLLSLVPVMKKNSIPFAVLMAIGLIPALNPLLLIEYRRELTFPHLVAHFLGLVIPVGILFLLKKRNGVAVACVCLGAFFFSTDVGNLIPRYSKGLLFGESGFVQTVRQLQELYARRAGPAILAAPRDIAFQMPGEAVFFDVTEPGASKKLASAQIVVSRTYGVASVFEHPKLKTILDQEFHCQKKVSAPGGRFVWWWKC